MTADDEPTRNADIYPMPMFAQFAVTDLDVSIDWYQSVAGFREVTLADPDGYRLVFTELVDTELSFEAATDRFGVISPTRFPRTGSRSRFDEKGSASSVGGV